MKRIIIAGTILLLAGCSINRQAEISSTDAPNGIVRLDYGVPCCKTPGLMSMLITVRQPKPVNMGYATASAYGQPIKTCTLISGSLCLNESVTIQYKCQGYAVTSSSQNPWY
ncbi:hypothetical protein EIN43_01405 [Enterobacter hormaechei]|uniref:Lipoprotein n=1 Tax=Enterobacter hormaechei TaxID=158836 RepID=A0A4Y5ZNU1_9ENTR|nr:hypothetical protein EIN43_01405 [Enterobacter hormaechei]